MTSESKQYLLVAIVILIVLLLVAIVYRKPDPSKDAQVSVLDLAPTITADISVVPTEPIVLTWRPYSNDKYNFTLSVPTQWQERDFADSYPNGGTLVAFSPNALPCATCTYVHDGYFSVIVYSKKTDPERYADFQKRIASIGKVAGYQKIQLDGSPGVFFDNLVAAEHGEWIYEFSLDQNEGNAKIADSQIFQKALNSFKFTDLQFSN